jgi:hypothetical protein
MDGTRPIRRTESWEVNFTSTRIEMPDNGEFVLRA